ncbi:hypothetical protein V490_01851 [Pseudogymnoascus sp. VKM F-3557]|nr:hypothetical protein V490_01851 [Pseudogymnoascus sp. VKM F-3557]
MRRYVNICEHIHYSAFNLQYNTQVLRVFHVLDGRIEEQQIIRTRPQPPASTSPALCPLPTSTFQYIYIYTEPSPSPRTPIRKLRVREQLFETLFRYFQTALQLHCSQKYPSTTGADVPCGSLSAARSPLRQQSHLKSRNASLTTQATQPVKTRQTTPKTIPNCA